MQKENHSDGAGEAARALREISIIAEIGRITGSTLDIEEVYGRFCARVKKLIPFDRLAINIHDGKNGLVRKARKSTGRSASWMVLPDCTIPDNFTG